MVDERMSDEAYHLADGALRSYFAQTRAIDEPDWHAVRAIARRVAELSHVRFLSDDLSSRPTPLNQVLDALVSHRPAPQLWAGDGRPPLPPPTPVSAELVAVTTRRIARIVALLLEQELRHDLLARALREASELRGALEASADRANDVDEESRFVLSALEAIVAGAEDSDPYGRFDRLTFAERRELAARAPALSQLGLRALSSAWLLLGPIVGGWTTEYGITDGK